MFDAKKEGVVGIDGTHIKNAIEGLDAVEQKLRSWNSDLVELRDLVVNEWYGGASDQFRGSYEALADTMEQMIYCAKVLREFSEDTAHGYGKVDDVVSDKVGMALRIFS